MKTSIFIFFSFILASGAVERPKDLFFEIHSDGLKSLFENKASVRKFEKFHCEVYWLDGKLDVVAVADGLGGELERIMQKACARKARLALPFDMNEYLEPFDKKEKKGDWQVYRDATGVHDINEVLIKDKGKDISIIEKRPIGTTKVKYHFKDSAKKVLEEVELTAYEGIQNISTKTTMKNKLIKGISLPVKVMVVSKQNLVRKETGSYTRDIGETFYFKNYKVNEAKALLHFSKSK